MCGIAGFVGNLKKKDLSLVMEQMVHRGSDSSGIFLKKGVGLGNNRLAVIGRKSGRQPIQSLNGRFTLTFNGEIYNFKEIKKELKKIGYKFKTSTDSEVVLNAYIEYGTDCLSKFNGMFAFAIWDDRKKQLFIARDRLGIKPLFYFNLPEFFVFSSELKGLLALSSIKKNINYQSIYAYLKLGYIPEPQTLFQNIQHLPAGSCIVYKKQGTIKLLKYWQLNQTGGLEISWEESKKLLEEKLRNSVERHLSSELPIGIFVSGGLDSGLIAGIASRFKKNISLFHFSFGSDNLDELGHAKFLSHGLGWKLHSREFKNNLVNYLPKIVWHLDQPLADPAIIPTYFLSEMAAKHVGVIFSGDGADEIFAGYRRYKYLLYLNKLLCKFSFGSNHLPDLYSSYMSKKLFGDGEIKKLLTNKFINKISLLLTDFWKPIGLNSDSNYLNRMLETDLSTWLPGDILLKTDRMSMAHTLEARVPYLDHEIVEFGLSLKPEYKISGLTDKAILRELGENFLPKQTSYRQKHGFSVPLGPVVSYAESVLTEKKVKDRGWFNEEYISFILRKSRHSLRHANQVFALLTLELWAELYLDSNQALINEFNLPI